MTWESKFSADEAFLAKRKARGLKVGGEASTKPALTNEGWNYAAAWTFLRNRIDPSSRISLQDICIYLDEWHVTNPDLRQEFIHTIDAMDTAYISDN